MSGQIAVAIIVATTSVGTLIATRAFDVVSAVLKRTQEKEDKADQRRDQCRAAVEAVLQCAQQWQANVRFAVIENKAAARATDTATRSAIQHQAQARFIDATESFRCFQDSLNSTLAQTDVVDLHPNLRSLLQLSTEIHSRYVEYFALPGDEPDVSDTRNQHANELEAFRKAFAERCP
ncbi:hypothetical protein AB0A73_24695 [Glycomyces sp. NPDC047369]